jgi:hypothetical protein
LALVSKLSTVARRLVLGRPFRSDRLAHTLLPKRIALPVFASDALSSVAYAPEEIFLVLSVAGLAAYSMAPWIGLAVAGVMLIVIASYRARVSIGRWRLRGGHHQPGPHRWSDGGQRAAGGLRPHRRGVDVLGDVEYRVGDSFHQSAQGSVRGRGNPAAGFHKFARHPRIGHRVRDPHLRVHDRHVHHARLGVLSDLRSRRTAPRGIGRFRLAFRTRRRTRVRVGVSDRTGVLVRQRRTDRR